MAPKHRLGDGELPCCTSKLQQLQSPDGSKQFGTTVWWSGNSKVVALHRRPSSDEMKKLEINNARRRWISAHPAKILRSLFSLSGDKMSFSHKICTFQDMLEWSREVQCTAEIMQRKYGWSSDLRDKTMSA